jgi:hypothetical protein
MSLAHTTKHSNIKFTETLLPCSPPVLKLGSFERHLLTRISCHFAVSQQMARVQSTNHMLVLFNVNLAHEVFITNILCEGEKILSTPSFGGEVKPSIPCRRYAACKRSLELRGSRFWAKFVVTFLAHEEFHLPLLVVSRVV